MFKFGKINALVMLLPALALTGCAAMFADKECTDGNWREVGRRDGGEGTFQAASWKTRCEEYDFHVDRAAYETGYREGIAQIYCTPEKARSIGADGRSYDAGQCPGRTDLRSAHEQGVKSYCTPQTAYSIGSRNEAFNLDLCGNAAPSLRTAYQNGVTEVYCRPSHAYDAGLNDERIELSACPARTETAFRLGVDVRAQNRTINDLNSEIYRLHAKADNNKLKDSEREQLRWRIQDLERERRRASEKRDSLESVARNL